MSKAGRSGRIVAISVSIGWHPGWFADGGLAGDAD